MQGNQVIKHKVEDIAKLAGVGTATVDRVLNERGNVSQKTLEKVLSAARRLKLKRVLPTTHRRVLRIEVLLARAELPLIARMKHEFGRLSERMDRSVIVQRTILKTDDPKVISKAISDTKADGLIIYPMDDQMISNAIAKVHARGVQVVTIISDIPSSLRLAYAGPDHYEAGRTSGFFMAKMARSPGAVAILCHNQKVLGHARRMQGFRDALALHNSSLEIAAVLEGGDDSRKSEFLLISALKGRTDFVGIYNVGAANDAVGAVLRQTEKHEHPIFIGHELTPESRQLLQEGLMTLVIDQNPEHQSRFAVDVLLHHFGYTDHRWLEAPYRSNIAFKLHCLENMTEFTAVEPAKIA
nr:LacI family DNA-binding transcriptional regulator [Aestuariivirga litoralis]